MKGSDSVNSAGQANTDNAYLANQKSVFKKMVRGVIILVLVFSVINLLWVRVNLKGTIIQNALLLSIIPLSLFARKYLYTRHYYLAARVFIVGILLALVSIVVTASEKHLMVGAMGILLLQLLISTLEKPEYVWRWGIVCAIIYGGSLLAHYLIASVDSMFVPLDYLGVFLFAGLGFIGMGWLLGRSASRYREVLLAETRQRKEIELLIRESHHRIKNNLNLVAGFIFNKMMDSEDNNCKIVLEDLANRIHSISDIHDQLHKSRELSEIEMEKYIKSLVSKIIGSSAYPETRLEFDVKKLYLDTETALTIGIICSELVTNAVKHSLTGEKSQYLSVAFNSADDGVVLRVGNNGLPLPEDFEMGKSKSFGTSMVLGLVDQLGGNISFESGKEMVFIINIPHTSSDQ